MQSGGGYGVLSRMTKRPMINSKKKLRHRVADESTVF